MGALEPPHLILILVIVLIIFGPGKLPQLGKAIGDGIRELKHATDDQGTADNTIRERATQPVAAASTTSISSRPCSGCNAQVPVTDRFCGACGANQAALTSTPRVQ